MSSSYYTRQICCNHAFDVIVPISSTMFQVYDITLCDYGHMLLHHPKEKENQRKIKRKSRKID